MAQKNNSTRKMSKKNDYDKRTSPSSPRSQERVKDQLADPHRQLSDEDADRLDQALDSNLSYNTKYYYKYVWRSFTDWSHNQGVNPCRQPRRWSPNTWSTWTRSAA